MSDSSKTLTYEAVAHRFDDIRGSVSDDVLHIPIGLDEKGEIYCVRLAANDNIQHAAVFGITGSGKINVINFALAGMQNLYGKGIKIHYLTGKAFEVCEWRGSLANAGVIREVHTADDLAQKLDEITTEVCKENCRSIVVLDNICTLLSKGSKDCLTEFERMVEAIPSYNSHILLVDQPSLASPASKIVKQWSAVGITKASYEIAYYFHGNSIAASAVDRYGNMIMQHRNSNVFVKVPYVSISVITDKLFMHSDS